MITITNTTINGKTKVINITNFIRIEFLDNKKRIIVRLQGGIEKLDYATSEAYSNTKENLLMAVSGKGIQNENNK